MGGFSTMNTAISGLMASQRALDITGQNVVNANTPGYSRQRVQVSSVAGAPASNFHTGSSQAVLGGVKIDTIERVRDVFLENTRVAAGASLEAIKAQTTALEGAEQLLSEPGDGGLQSVIDDFYNSWHDLAQKPTDPGAGAVVIQRGKTVAAQLAFVSNGLEERWETARDELSSTVAQLNQAAADLAKVNERIRQGNVVGRPVNELIDQRDTLVRTIGELAGGKPSVTTDDGMVSVSVNGLNLVTGNRAERFELTGATTLATATIDPPTVTFGNSQVSVASGKAAGLLAALRTDLPNVSAQLDGLAVALRDAVNTVHSAGFTVGGAPGRRLLRRCERGEPHGGPDADLGARRRLELGFGGRQQRPRPRRPRDRRQRRDGAGAGQHEPVRPVAQPHRERGHAGPGPAARPRGAVDGTRDGGRRGRERRRREPRRGDGVAADVPAFVPGVGAGDHHRRQHARDTDQPGEVS